MADDGLDTMTRSELLAIADERKVVLPPGYVTHHELVALLRAQPAAEHPPEK